MTEEYSKKSVRSKKSKGKMERPREEEEVEEPNEAVEEDFMPMKNASKRPEQKLAQLPSKIPPATKAARPDRKKFYSEEMRPTYQQESVPNELESAFEALQKLETDYQNESISYSSMPQQQYQAVSMPNQQYQTNAMPQQYRSKGPPQQYQQQTKGGFYAPLPPITVTQDINEIFQKNLQSSSITEFRVSR
jgi:hypothetical protein